MLPGAATFLKHHVHFVPFLEGELCNPNCDLLTAVSSAHAQHLSVGPYFSLGTQEVVPLLTKGCRPCPKDPQLYESLWDIQKDIFLLFS